MFCTQMYKTANKSKETLYKKLSNSRKVGPIFINNVWNYVKHRDLSTSKELRVVKTI